MDKVLKRISVIILSLVILLIPCSFAYAQKSDWHDSFNKRDDWNNNIQSNQDGEAEFTVLNSIKITKMELYVNTSGDDIKNSDIPQIQSITNAKKEKCVFQKTSVEKGYRYYQVLNPNAGKWKLQLEKEKSKSVGDVEISIVYYTDITAKFYLGKDIDNLESGNYRALIRLYKEEKVKDISEATYDVKYAMYDGLKKEGYAFMPATKEIPGKKEKIAPYYKAQRIIVAGNYGEYTPMVFLMNTKNGIRIVVDTQESEDEFKKLYPNTIQKFLGWATDKKIETITVVFAGFILVILFVFLLKKTFKAKKKEDQDSIIPKMEKEELEVDKQYEQTVSNINSLKKFESIFSEKSKKEEIPWLKWFPKMEITDKAGTRSYRELESGIEEKYKFLKESYKSIRFDIEEPNKVTRVIQAVANKVNVFQTDKIVDKDKKMKELRMQLTEIARQLIEQCKKIDDIYQNIVQAKKEYDLYNKKGFPKNIEFMKLVIKDGDIEYYHYIFPSSFNGDINRGIQPIYNVEFPDNQGHSCVNRNYLLIAFDENDKVILVSDIPLETGSVKEAGKYCFGQYRYVMNKREKFAFGDGRELYWE